jgi:hypothetical protein
MRRITMPLLGAATLLAACAAPAAPRAAPGSAARVARPVPPGTWEVVMPGRRLTGAPQGPETARLDDALAARSPETVMDQDLWPPARAPRLDDLRGRFISDDPRVVNYYSAYGAGSAWWWHGGWRWR